MSSRAADRCDDAAVPPPPPPPTIRPRVRIVRTIVIRVVIVNTRLVAATVWRYVVVFYLGGKSREIRVGRRFTERRFASMDTAPESDERDMVIVRARTTRIRVVEPLMTSTICAIYEYIDTVAF